jgi:hydroxyethylthiazole kinase-like uncharacterized protein yjeF
LIPVLSREQMRAFDQHAIQVCKVAGVLLMENAGRGAADAIVRRMTDTASWRAVVVAGPGNNGGDGFVVARHLLARGSLVQVFLTAPVARFTGDALTQLDALRGVGAQPVELHEDLTGLRAALGAADVVVDAIFGTGLDRPVTGLPAAVIQAMNEAPGIRVALDVPSGLDADKGVTMGACIAADLTVTFGHYKLGLLTPHGGRMAGKVEVAGVGVPPLVAGRGDHSALLIEPSDVARTIARRTVDQYKNGAGHVVVLAGSRGHIGACLMASHAAMRAGAGLVTVATWEESMPAIESRVVEIMTARISRDNVAESIDQILEGKRAVVIGPGFGLDDAARSAVEHVLRTWEGPTVFDADALSMFEQAPEVFAASKGAPVLTPHPGELARLLGTSARDVEADRFGAVRQLVDRARCVVVLKGAHTLIGAPEEHVVVNASGNASMATAGAGDVLSGIVGALLCTADPFEAAWAGVHLHGAAADAWSASHGGADRGLLASEIADHVPRTLAGLAALAPAHGRWRI